MHKSKCQYNYKNINFDRFGRFLIFAMLPCSLVIARQSSPAILFLGFAFILMNSIKSQNLSEIKYFIKNNFFNINYIIILIFSIYALISIFWSYDYRISLHQLIWEFLFPVLIGGLAVALVDKSDRMFSVWVIFLDFYLRLV